MAWDVGEVTGSNIQDCLQEHPRVGAVLETTGKLCLELFGGMAAAFTLALTFEKVPCMCPWDSAFGAEFDVIADGEVLVRLAKDNRFCFVLFGLSCQAMTWARSPPRSWDSIWSKSGLVGLALERVQTGNNLLLFTVQLCLALCEAGCFFFSVENPELCWTWAFAVFAFVHNFPGVAVVKVYCDQCGTRCSNPTLFLHSLPCVHSLAELPEQRVGEQICPRGRCWYKGESRLMTSFPSQVGEIVCKSGSEFVGVEEKRCPLWWKSANGSLQVRCRPSFFSCDWTFLPARALVDFLCHARVCGYFVVAWNHVGEECRIALWRSG